MPSAMGATQTWREPAVHALCTWCIMAAKCAAWCWFPAQKRAETLVRALITSFDGLRFVPPNWRHESRGLHKKARYVVPLLNMPRRAPERCPAVGVITGSDDSTVRRMLFGIGKGPARFTDSAEVGTHAAGTHVRALAAVGEADEGEHSA